MNAKNRIARGALLAVTVALAVSAPLAGGVAQAKGPHENKAILKAPSAAILKAEERAILKHENKAILKAIL